MSARPLLPNVTEFAASSIECVVPDTHTCLNSPPSPAGPSADMALLEMLCTLPETSRAAPRCCPARRKILRCNIFRTSGPCIYPS